MLIALVVFAAALVQGVLGFGGALIAMPLLVMLIGVKTAAPAFAFITVLATLLNAFHWRAHVTPRDLIQLGLPALVGIPLGVWLLSRVDEALVTRALGASLVLYAAYVLLGLAVPPPRRRLWAYLAGFTSGVLTGAYNTGGPPVIVYATARRWPADQLRGNLQTYFLFSSVLALASHGLAGHLTATVWRTALLFAPAMLVGHFLGVWLCRYVDAERFQRLALLFLLAIGLQLLLAG